MPELAQCAETRLCKVSKEPLNSATFAPHVLRVHPVTPAVRCDCEDLSRANLHSAGQSLRWIYRQKSLCFTVEQFSKGKLKKLIITGANGIGKSHFADKLVLARPEIPVISFDAIKLKTDWQQRPRDEINTALAGALETEAWILEGGPSLLAQAIEKADALVWLDPPEHVRAWQLAARPWKHIGSTRPELPPGNIDWPWQQYKFALRSLKNRSKFRT